MIKNNYVENEMNNHNRKYLTNNIQEDNNINNKNKIIIHYSMIRNKIIKIHQIKEGFNKNNNKKQFLNNKIVKIVVMRIKK